MERGSPDGEANDDGQPLVGEAVFAALNDAAGGTVRWVRIGEARRTEAVLALWDAMVADEAADGVRRLVASARLWTRVETDPVDDAILAFDSAERAIPTALRRLIPLHAERCEEPGCPTGAHLSDLDHVIRVEHGGRTTEINLTALCRPAHQTKDDGYVDVERIDGDLHWSTTRWGGHFVTRSRMRIRRRPTPRTDGRSEPAPWDLPA